MPTEQSEPIWKSDRVIAHTGILARSLEHWTGRELVSDASGPVEISQAVFEAPFVVVSHGTEPDPVLNYGNQAALRLWEMSWEDLTATPSRFTAEAPNREERARLLEAVHQHGYINDYCGVRISKSGRRFRIERAIVWNLVTAGGALCGQAAMFDQWHYL
jgi:hypothetical protein